MGRECLPGPQWHQLLHTGVPWGSTHRSIEPRPGEVSWIKRNQDKNGDIPRVGRTFRAGTSEDKENFHRRHRSVHVGKPGEMDSATSVGPGCSGLNLKVSRGPDCAGLNSEASVGPMCPGL